MHDDRTLCKNKIGPHGFHLKAMLTCNPTQKNTGRP